MTSVIDTQKHDKLGKRAHKQISVITQAGNTSTTCSQQNNSSEKQIDPVPQDRTPVKLGLQGKGQLNILNYCKDKDGNRIIIKEPVKKHHRSLWMDEDLQPKDLEQGEDIFSIIMPWVAEKQADDKKVKLQNDQTNQTDSKVQVPKAPTAVQTKLNFLNKKTTPTPAVVKPAVLSKNKMNASKEKTLDLATETKRLSHVHTMINCEEFNFEF